MSSGDAGGGFLSLFIWRMVRDAAYWLVGLLAPHWREALHLVRVRDRYVDQATMNVGVYSDPKFEANVRLLESEVRRVRRRGRIRPVELMHDFPPGSAEQVRKLTEVDGHF